MDIDLNAMNQDDVRRALERVIRQANSDITQWAVDREVALAALAELDGEGFEHHKVTITMHENDIAFATKKLEAAEARLAELD